MAKYYGMIGFSIQKEIRPGVWQEESHEHPVYGDVDYNTIRNENGGQVNDDVALNSRISIIFDPFVQEHASQVKYITYLGAKWKITSITPTYPRMTINIGGVYND